MVMGLATGVPGGQAADQRTWTQAAVTVSVALVAVLALHTADHAKHVANIAAAFTPMAGRGDEQVLNWSGLPLTSRFAIGLWR